MTSTITNTPNKVDRSGHNLDLLLSYARKAGGVIRITVFKLNDKGRPPEMLRIFYKDLALGKIYFSGIGENWARRKSELNPKVSWFAGCDVEVVNVPAGGWDYEKDKLK